MWDAITQNQGAEPPADANDVYFPIIMGKKKFKDCGFHKFPFPKSLSTWLETIQPGTADPTPGHPDSGLQNTLEDINNLARLDRHRRLRIVAAIPGDTRVEVETTPADGFIEAEDWLPCDLFGGKYDFLRMKVTCPGGLVPYHTFIKTRITFHLLAEDIPHYDSADIGVTLGRFAQAVEHIVDKFEAEFT